MGAQAPQTVGRYELLERIGAGGMGEVWKVRAPAALGRGKLLALKRMSPSLEGEAGFEAMFQDEARVSFELTHPNLVQVLDAGRDARGLFLVMELVDGPDLRGLLRAAGEEAGRTLPTAAALWIAREVARALAYAHRARGADGRRLGLIHRDVSPANVLCSREGDVKLTDFGLAQTAERAYRSLFGDVKGKVSYMAPEQARGEPLDGRSDLFGLGATLYHVVCGVPPYADVRGEAALLAAVQRGAWRVPGQLASSLPEPVIGLLARLMAPALERRPRDADEAMVAIEDCSHQCGIVLSPRALAAEVVALVSPVEPTLPPHPFGRALGIGLGIGGGLGDTGSGPQVTAPMPPAPSPTGRSGHPGHSARARRFFASVVIAVVAAGVGAAAGHWVGRRAEQMRHATAVLQLEPASAIAANGQRSASSVRTTASEPPVQASRVPVPGTIPPAAPRSAATAARTRGGAIPKASNGAAAETREQAHVSLGSSPWADVTLDGKPLCRTPLGCRNLTLAAGQHELAFRNPEAGRCKRLSTLLKPGQNATIVVDLDPCP